MEFENLLKLLELLGFEYNFNCEGQEMLFESADYEIWMDEEDANKFRVVKK